MNNSKPNWSIISSISAFLIGVILFWSFGKDWLPLESLVVFLAGLIGVGLAVLLARAWEINHHSGKDKE